MVTIVGISGSLRKHSFNAGLLRAAAEAVPEGAIYGLPNQLKFFDIQEGIKIFYPKKF